MVRRRRRRFRTRDPMKKRRLVFAAFFLLFLAAAVFSATKILGVFFENAAAQKEYEELRAHLPTPGPAGSSGTAGPAGPAGSAGSFGGASPSSPAEQAAFQELARINPDFTGWIRIDGTAVDYPVVQGTDNDKYIGTTFAGERNPSGAIFMDWRRPGGFAATFSILYGHNMKNGSMFAGLLRYREEGYLAEHPDITVFTPGGEILQYPIFAVLPTDIWDEAFTLFDKDWADIKQYFSGHGAPENAERFLVLSTCTENRNSDERLLILAARYW